MRTFFALILIVCVAARVHAEPQTFMIYDFQFENGSVLPELRVAYETKGKLNAGRDNAILLVHGTSGDRHAFDPIIGPGKTFDTDKNFVITVDAIGGGDSSSPKDGLGQDFPRYTIRDMVTAQHALVTRGLELATLRAVGGVAMRMLRTADLYGMVPSSARAQTILALLLWGGVTAFIFGIVIDLFH